MEATQEAEQDVKQEARRLLPLDTFEPEELEEMAGGAAPLIINGSVQYWQMGATVQNRRDTPGAVDSLFGPRRQQDAMQAALHRS